MQILLGIIVISNLQSHTNIHTQDDLFMPLHFQSFDYSHWLTLPDVSELWPNVERRTESCADKVGI